MLSTSKLRTACERFARFHQQDDGMVSWALLVAIMFLLCFAGLVYNSGNVVNRKLETQNAADAASYSGSLWIARGMNAMTASNHVIGELNALYVLHHSLCGKWMDEQGRTANSNHRTLKSTNGALQVAYRVVSFADPISAQQSQYEKVVEDPNADRNSMVFEAKLTLKRVMIGAYAGHAVGFGMTKFPITYAAGVVVEAAALLVESKCYQEYLVLDGIEMAANATRVPKKAIPTVMHRGLYQGYQQLMLIVNIPRLASNSAESVAAKQGAKGVVHGDFPDELPTSVMEGIGQAARVFPLLPVEKENAQEEERSQLMRATYPWVARWRTPINKFLRLTCTFSGAASKYTRWTNRYSLQACTWLRRKSDAGNYREALTVENFRHGGSGNGEKGKELRLFVVTGLNKTEKGIAKSQELWNDWDRRSAATSEIEKQFCHVGFATHKPPTVQAARFYRQENPHGIICFAQSMVYNANPQQRPTPPGAKGGNQPKVGWDTLNWVERVPEFPRDTEDEVKLSSDPAIKLNWQAKLTPVTPQKLVRVIPKAIIDPSVRSVLAATREGLILTSH